MFEEIYEFNGQEPGGTSIILGGVHGNETCGVAAIKEVMSNLTIQKGRVLFAYGNPRAIDQNKRFTETNLNRLFKPDNLLSEQEKSSYEYFRAQFLKTFLNQADALLDIHASFTAKSKPFIICEQNAAKIISLLPIDLVVSGFDKVEPGGTDYYMNSHGKIGICVECGFLGDPEATLIAKESILSFLSAQEHIDRQSVVTDKTYISVFSLYITKTNSFILSKQFEDFEEIHEGQVIGTDGDSKLISQEDSIILFARDCRATGEEAFLLGRKKNSLA